MAKIEFKGIREYEKQIEQLGKAGTAKMIRFAVYPAAGTIIDEIKKDCPVDTGDLRESIKLSEFREDEGYIYTKVEFVGYDRKGVPNVLKARVLESGRSNQKKRPFIRKAVNRKKKAAEALMQNGIDMYLYNTFRK